MAVVLVTIGACAPGPGAADLEYAETYEAVLTVLQERNSGIAWVHPLLIHVAPDQMSLPGHLPEHYRGPSSALDSAVARHQGLRPCAEGSERWCDGVGGFMAVSAIERWATDPDSASVWATVLDELNDSGVYYYYRVDLGRSDRGPWVPGAVVGLAVEN